MKSYICSKTGIVASSNGSEGGDAFLKSFVDSCEKEDQKEREAIRYFRSKGIKAAHPDDGWVNRVDNSLSFAYPSFNDGASIGDLVALTGGITSKTRIVRLLSERKGILSSRWFFEVVGEPKEMKSNQLTIINNHWQMSWVVGNAIAHRDLFWWEKILYWRTILFTNLTRKSK